MNFDYVSLIFFPTFRPHRMREMRTIAINDPVAWASVSLSRE